MRRLLVGLAGFLFGLTLAGMAAAQDARQNEPGKFDFYVLALSWSPSFCEQAGDRKSAEQQCGGRPFSFVVHGLWPQYEKGFPEFCTQPAPFVDNGTVNAMLDLMPARGLIINEWKKHGVCSGMNYRGYFETVRKARALVKIPPEFLELKAAITVSPDEVEEAFVKANPELDRKGIAVTCSRSSLSEVRICLSRDLKFRECEQIDRQACRRDKLSMPPVRGG